MTTGECQGPQQIWSSFWFQDCRNYSERMLDTLSVRSLVKYNFCWQFHEVSFLQCSWGYCKHIIACLHGTYLSLSQLNLSVGDEKWPLPLILSYMRQVLRMGNDRSNLSFKDRIGIFIETMEIIVFTWLVLDIFLIYQCIFMSQALG